MGCGGSKLDNEEEIPAALRPFRSRIEEMKHRQGGRNASMASTTELLKPEEREYDLPEEAEKKKAEAESEHEEEKGIIVIEEAKKVDEEKKEWEDKLGGGLDEDLLASPSFRFYFTDMAPFDSDDDSVKVIQEIKNEELATANEGDQKKGNHEREASDGSLSSTTSNEESDSKLLKKDRGGRFKALTQAPGQVYSFLTVRK